MSFATRCLPVGKDRPIVTAQNIFDDFFCCFIVHFLLCGIRPKDFIEDVDFTLERTGDRMKERKGENCRAYTYQHSFLLIGRKLHNTSAARSFFRIVQRTKASNYTYIAFIGRHSTVLSERKKQDIRSQI